MDTTSFLYYINFLFFLKYILFFNIFTFLLQIYSDKTNREIGEINRKSLKEETHEKRVSLAVPHLNNEMTKLENDLKNILPELSKEIKSGVCNFCNTL